MPKRPGIKRRAEAEQAFRTETDTREDRDVLRAWKIDYMTVVGGRRKNVPTVEDEEAMLRAAIDERKGPVPRVWKARPRGPSDPLRDPRPRDLE